MVLVAIVAEPSVAKVMMNFSQEPHILLLIWYGDTKAVQLTILTRQRE